MTTKPMSRVQGWTVIGLLVTVLLMVGYTALVAYDIHHALTGVGDAFKDLGKDLGSSDTDPSQLPGYDSNIPGG